MKFESVVDSLNFAWDQVVVGFWARYPNPFTTHVLTEDVLRRELRPDGTLYTCRLLMKTNSIPRWGQALMPARRVPIIEESIVDADNKTLTTYCRNITHKSIMETTEKVVYTSQEDDNGKLITRCLKTFWVSSQWYAPTGGLIERFGIQRWVKNVGKTRSGMEHVLSQIYLVDDDVDEVALETTSSSTTHSAANDLTPSSISSAKSSSSSAAAIRMHPFIVEKRRMLKERAASMGNKAKEKLERTREKTKEKYERTKENAIVTIETAQDNLKANLGNS